MQGIIFVAIHQHLRELGDEELRRQCFPEGSSYLAFRDYPETDLVRIARAISDGVPSLQQSVGEVLRSLGEEVPALINRTTPALLPKTSTLQALLELLSDEEAVGRVVLPRLRVVEAEDGRVTLEHLGDASVCRFDEGLLIGLAALVGEKVAMRHPECRQRKDDRCVFLPRITTAEPTRGRTSLTLRFSPDEEGTGKRSLSGRPPPT